MCAAIATGRFPLSRIQIDHAAGDFWPVLPIETDPAVDITRRQNHVRRIIVSLHGTGGDAVMYYNRAVQALNLRPDLVAQTLVVAPQFFYQDLATPSRSEVNGAFGRDIVYWESGRAYGALSASNTQNPRTFAERSYHAMDALLEHLTRPDLFPNLRLLVLLGHSNGGQFVARYAAINTFEDRHARRRGVHIRYVPMNAGSFLYLTDRRWHFTSNNYLSSAASSDNWRNDVAETASPATGCGRYNAWPWGMSGMSDDRVEGQGVAELIAHMLGRNVIYMAGEQDTVAGGTCEDDRQGPNTLARTLLYYHGLQQTCGSGLSRVQKVVVVPGVGHNGLDMMTSNRGVEEIFRAGPALGPEGDMATRILTGIVVPSRPVGTVTVSFNPHRVTGDGTGTRLHEAGAHGDYAGTPGISVSVRQFKVDKDREDYYFKVDDKDRTRDSVTVGWSYNQKSPIQELSYVIAGDVRE